MAKDRTEKTALEMNFEEFCKWATGYILFGIGEGRRLAELVSVIVDHATRNETFRRGRNNNAYETLRKVADRLEGCCYGDATVAEQQIARILIADGLLTRDQNGDLRRP